jgi:hypothetical protein
MAIAVDTGSLSFDFVLAREFTSNIFRVGNISLPSSVNYSSAQNSRGDRKRRP